MSAVKELPVVTVRDIVLFPGMSMQFDLEKRASVRAIEAAMLSDGRFFMIMLSDDGKQTESFSEIFTEEMKKMMDHTSSEDPDPESFIGQIGMIAKVSQMIRLDNNMIRVQVIGEKRALLDTVDADSAPYATGVALDAVTIPISISVEREALRRELVVAFEKLARETGNTTFQDGKLRKIKNAGELADKICGAIGLEDSDRLGILQTLDEGTRCRRMLGMLSNELSILRSRKSIAEQISKQVDEHQREYILREQLSYIKSELNDDTDEESEIDHYKKATEELDASEEVKAKLRKAIKHLEQNGSSQEGAVERAYIETLLELPWDKTSPDFENIIDIQKAQEILDRDHYGLKDVKERVLEYLAVRALSKKGDSAILCLIGPPGTGKTSIAQSVAEATKKPYVRICLGGVRDEAEIRGHRKTYVGAMPGRITAALRQAKVRDPLMLLDEIDKMSQDYRSDTASAMLEVLDSEQNKNFRDHYVELPQNLSDILFIATANDEENIPRPLLDRMEVIEIAGYTANEKFHIAKEHLMGKTYEKTGIKPSQLHISDSAIRRIIECYCREAGVRELERELSKLCRKAAVEILRAKNASGKTKKTASKRISITADNLEKYLGKIKYPPEQMNKKNDIGIVRGLAWTAVGGATLQVEVNIMPGKGELSLTGQLGDVMKESAMAALTYVRSISPAFNVADDFFQSHDIHIHIPEGAVPKDGPSAGITMATAILSAVTRKKVNRKVAMTGEISLRGNVMPVGGLKEKVLAAKMMGIRTVLVPAENRRNIEEIDEEIKNGMDIIFVKEMEEVIAKAFV
ncbi:MAG: endopeptidase La [Lachnospiraceae bacterium]|nr:endopeptidase La [Lachnospiraceae bacterium]